MLLCLPQLARLRVQLQQQGIALPDGPHGSMELHPGDVPDLRKVNTSGDSAASLPVSHISPR